jgi:hypothetical protein
MPFHYPLQRAAVGDVGYRIKFVFKFLISPEDLNYTIILNLYMYNS